MRGAFIPGQGTIRSAILRVMFMGVGVLVGFHCSPSRFPVLHPVPTISRAEMAQGKAEEYFIKARDLERRGLHREAERLYEMAFDLDPSSRVLRDQLTRKYIESGKLMQALLLIKGDRILKELDTDELRIVAGIYIKTGDFMRAIEAIRSIRDPTDKDYYSLAIMYESLGNTEKALLYYLLFYDENSSSFELGLKIVRLLVGAGRFTAADTLLASLEETHGQRPALFEIEGTVALAQHDTARALALFNQAIGIDSSYDEAIRSAAQIHLQRGDYPQAILYYEMLYRNSTVFKNVYGRTLAILYYYDRRFTLAESLLKSLLESAFDDEELHYYLGLVFAATKRAGDARLQLEKAVALHAGYAEAWRELCYLSIREERYDEALATAQRFVRKSPENKSSWRLKGYVCNLKKKYKQSIKAFTKALGLDTADATTWFELGSSYERTGNISRAADMFRKVLSLRPGDPAASNYLGYMWAEKGMRLDSAEVLIHSALSRDPFNGAYLDSYAWIFFQKGSVEEAYAWIKESLARVANDPVVYEHLGDILLQKNYPCRARDAYQKSIEFNHDHPDSIRRKIIETFFLEPLPDRKGRQ